MPWARNTDPQTSHDAADSVRETTATQNGILRVLAHKPQTDVQIIEAYRKIYFLPKASESGIRSRRAELVERGLVKDSGLREKMPSGRFAIVWRTA